MNYIIDRNSTGKTRKMLEEAQKNGAVIVCKHPLHMQSKANAYGIYGLKFIGYDEVDVDIVNEEKIAVDEICEFFKHRYGAELDSFTMTID